MCEGVGRDSGYGHEESHLMHDMKSFHVRIAIVWNVNRCLCAITCAFRWRVTLVGKFIYWALFTPSWENNFRYLRYSGGGSSPKNSVVKKKANFGFVLCFVNFG